MFKDKAYVCNLCRKVITYSPKEAGKTFPCPFCKTTVTLPRKWAPLAGAAPRKKSAIRLTLAGLAVLSIGAAALFSLLVAKDKAPPLPPVLPALPNLFGSRVAVAPEPARVRGTHLSVAVTDTWYGCPAIHDASLNKTAPMQTPVCCVTLSISNTGEKSASFTPWRELDHSSGLTHIILSEAGGRTNSLVSYGYGCAPVGTQQRAEIAPGETLKDTLLFLCEKKPSADLELTLPCENVGGRGQISFRIPCGRVR